VYLALMVIIKGAKSIGLATLLALSLAVAPTVLSGSLTSVQISSNSKPITYVHAQEEHSGEETYLRFVSDIVQQQSTDNTNTTTIQIPETAKGPAIPAEKGYLVQEIGDQLYSVSDGSYNTMFMVTDEGVIAVDAPPTLGANYLKAIAEVTDKPTTHVIYSHAHMDHIGAARIFPENATFVAQQETASELQRAMNLATNTSMVPPVPTETFSKNMTLKVGNQTLQLDYYGNNHLPGNIFIYAPQQKVLMLVDIIFPGWIPFPYLAIAKDTAGFIEAHDIALNNYDFDTIVGGHLTRLGTNADVGVQREFVMDLEKAADNANQNVSFSGIASQVGSFDNPWLLFSKYIDAINKQCEEVMLPKWESKLGGAEIFMLTHCFTMTESGRVDPTIQALFQD
jgi:glyoxylase-like metal-dependent hydrolase (beta-lactamase superfamily II)